MAHFKHQSVRVLYAYCCGYCGLSETDAGGELTVDHHEPVSAGGDDSDDNLVYACFRCNLHKGAFTPSEAQRAQGLRLLHPLRDNLAEHLRENRETGRLESLTALGALHIFTLELNRDALIANRLQRWQQARLAARLDQAEAEALERDAILLRRDAEIRDLKQQLRRMEEQDNTE